MIKLFADSFSYVDSFDGSEYFYECQFKDDMKSVIPAYNDDNSYNLVLSTGLPFIIIQEQDEYGCLLRELKLNITSVEFGIFKLTLDKE